MRWIYVARLSVAAAIYLAALFVWLQADESSTLIASLAFVAAMVFTALSVIWTEVYRLPAAATFKYLQSVFDLVLVTAIVHITGGSESQFTALYTLVIAAAALLHQPRGVVLVAALGIVLFFADALVGHRIDATNAVWLQLSLFAFVALGSGFVAARLRAEGTGREEMAAELARFRLREPDVARLRNRAERLEAVAQMSASLAHEIKNPLAAIRSAVEQLSASPRATDDERSLGGLVVRESDRLSRLLTEFLEFARLEATRRVAVDMREVVRGAVRLAESHPGRDSGVELAMILPSRPLIVDGDADVLHRAVFNLVLNALQASPGGGVVRVEADEISSRQTPTGEVAFLRGSIAVRVSDQGSGVPPDMRDRMFEPFVTTKRGGSGLGLAIVQRAVTAHGGHVVVDSSSTGTRFTLLLPKPTPSTARAANA